MGTPQYMSVEQARGRDDIDLRADIWSAGAILYELTTGRVAFDAANYNAVLDKIMHEDPLPLLSSGVNEPALQAIISRCLSKQRGQRYQSARELREALLAVLPSLPVGAGGLKLQSSVGISVAPGLPPDSVAPPKLDEIGPAIPNVSRDPTLVAPPSDPRITPLRNDLLPSAQATDDRPSSTPAMSLSPLSTRKRARRVAVTLGGLAGAAAILVVLSMSGGSSPTGAAPALPVVVPAPAAQEEPPAAAPRAKEEPASEPSPAVAPAPRAASSTAAAASAKKPAPTKPKSVTRVESAGF
jgi:serine/threonine protein kinase